MEKNKIKKDIILPIDTIDKIKKYKDIIINYLNLDKKIKKCMIYRILFEYNQKDNYKDFIINCDKLKKEIVPVFVNPDDYLKGKIYLVKWYYPIAIYGSSSNDSDKIEFNFFIDKVLNRLKEGYISIRHLGYLSLFNSYCQQYYKEFFINFFLYFNMLTVGLNREFRKNFINCSEDKQIKLIKSLFGIKKIEKIDFEKGIEYLKKYNENKLKKIKNKKLVLIENCKDYKIGDCVLIKSYKEIEKYCENEKIAKNLGSEEFYFIEKNIHFVNSMKDYCQNFFILREVEKKKYNYYKLLQGSYTWINEWIKGKFELLTDNEIEQLKENYIVIE